jgi:hypothetical protein
VRGPDRGRNRRAATAGTVFAVALLLAIRAAPAAGADAGGDSLGVHLELGVASDLTNEIFYEDEFVDTTFVGRRLVGDPEHRLAAVFLVALDGTRGAGTTRYAFRNEVVWGDLVQGDRLGLVWRTEPTPDWRLTVSPSTEFRHDGTFDRDMTESRSDVTVKARRAFQDGMHAFEWAARGELVRTSGEGSEFLLDRQGVRLSAAFERADWTGQDLRIGYGLWARAFPDSSIRDHFEHGVELAWRSDAASGAVISLDADVARRVTFDVVETTRDNFWGGHAGLEGSLPVATGWSLRARLDGEAQRYDVPDSTVFFDYQVAGVRLTPRWEPHPGLAVAAGPWVERLWSAWNPAESYTEVAGSFELEWLGGRGWWSLTPAVGWREYEQTRLADLALHSPYAFYDFTVIGDQPLAGSLRLRAFANARLESHTESAQDARSLYFSIDVRTLF